MELLCETPRAWVQLAIDRFDEVLVDHAHCEKKAAAQALSMLAAFPSVPGLARAMARLAREEAGHLGQVLALMEERGLPLGRDPGDPRFRFPAGRAAARGGCAGARAALKAGDSLKAARRSPRFRARRASGTCASARGGWPDSGAPRSRRGPG